MLVRGGQSTIDQLRGSERSLYGRVLRDVDSFIRTHASGPLEIVSWHFRVTAEDEDEDRDEGTLTSARGDGDIL